MSTNICVVFVGPRLDGATVALFYDKVRQFEKARRSRGIGVLCRKSKYPEYDHPVTVHASGPEIARLEVFVSTERGYTIYAPPWAHYEATAAAAWQYMLDYGSVDKIDSGYYPFLDVQFRIRNPAPGLYAASGRTGFHKLRLRNPEQLDPEWYDDENITMTLNLTPPRTVVLDPSFRLAVDGKIISYGGGVQDVPLSKLNVFAPGYGPHIAAIPNRFPYEQYLLLPPGLEPDGRGYTSTAINEFPISIIVRRSTGVFKACWPEDIYAAADYIGVVDTISRLPVGPLLRTRKGF